MLFLYDGTFEGLLTALAEALVQAPADAEFASAALAQPSLWQRSFRVDPSPARAEAFFRRVREEISPGAAGRLASCWAAEKPRIEPILLEYVRLGLQHGAAVDRLHTSAAVRQVALTAARVGGEIHRLHGLLRFRHLADGSFYGPIAPDANIAPAVAWHFRQRLAAEKWVIHDTRRGLGVFWDRQRLEVLDIAGAPGGTSGSDPALETTGMLHEDETLYQDLWRTYYRTVAIPERRNLELQRRCMPRRYWPFLVERPDAG